MVTPILVQHTVGAIKCQSQILYDVLAAVLDIWFQLAFWANIFSFPQEESIFAAGFFMMYAGHILYWLAALSGYCLGMRSKVDRAVPGSNGSPIQTEAHLQQLSIVFYFFKEKRSDDASQDNLTRSPKEELQLVDFKSH